MENLHSDAYDFKSVINDLGKADPIVVTLSAPEALTTMTIIKLAGILRPDLDLRKSWEKFNENHTLKELRDSKSITIKLSAVEAFALITSIQLIIVKDSQLGIMAALAHEAGRKIHSHLDQDSAHSRHLNKGWAN